MNRWPRLLCWEVYKTTQQYRVFNVWPQVSVQFFTDYYWFNFHIYSAVWFTNAYPGNMLSPSLTTDLCVRFSYHRCCPAWNQHRRREVCSNRCYWSIWSLSQQIVYVAGQTGGGAHCVVPQNKDCIIQSIQAILHSRLGGPEDWGARG